MQVKTLAQLAAAGRLAGRRVFIRSDLNVPQDAAGNITEDTRIRASVPAIELALSAGAAVIQRDNAASVKFNVKGSKAEFTADNLRRLGTK